MKQILRNILGLGSVATLCMVWSACSDGGGTPIGAAGTGFTSGGSPPAVGGTGSAGTPPVGTGGSTPVPPLGGSSGSATTGGTGTGGTGTAGTATGGTGTAGTATGGTAAGGTAAGGTGTGGTGGGGGFAFPANCPAPLTTAHGATAATRTCWNAKASDCAATGMNMNPPLQALDNAPATRFSTGVKMTDATVSFTYEVDMGSATMINGIKVESQGAMATMDYARGLEVSVSPDDGGMFTPVACSDGMPITEFTFAPISAKVVRFTQFGIGDAWWSIHELNVYRADGAADTCGTARTPTNTCTVNHTQ